MGSDERERTKERVIRELVCEYNHDGHQPPHTGQPFLERLLRAAYDAGVQAERERRTEDADHEIAEAAGWEERAWCPYCGAEHEIVRPGKTQPTCDCQECDHE